MRRFVLQASGKHFLATRFAGEGVEVFDAGHIGAFGKWLGRISGEGVARFGIELDYADRESAIMRLCQHVQLLQRTLRAHGAETFVLFMYREFTRECNEEAQTLRRGNLQSIMSSVIAVPPNYAFKRTAGRGFDVS